MKTFKLPLFIFALLLSLCGITAQEIEGNWKGNLSVQGNEIPVVFDITKEDQSYKATMDSPAQNAFGLELDDVKLLKDSLSLTLNAYGISYKGKVEGESIIGTFSQGGQNFDLTLNKSEKTLPGDPSLPSSKEELAKLAQFDKGNYKYDVEDYFARPKARTFRFSPNGKFLSYREKDENNKNHIYVKNLETGEINRAIEEKEELIRGYAWANNERLLYVMDKGGNENYHLFAADIDGSETRELTPYDEVRVELLNELKEDKDHVIISMNKNNPQIFEPYKINIKTGELEQLYTNDNPQNPIVGYMFDKDGELRGFGRLHDGVKISMYYKKDGEFKEIQEFAWNDTFNPQLNYSNTNPHEAYLISNLDSDKTEIYRYDLKEGKILEKMFSNKEYDISSISLSRNRDYELDYYSYEGEKQRIVPVSDYYKKLHEKITTKFPEMNYSIADHTDDESKYLIFLQSDKLYGEYWSYDAKTEEFELLYNLMPQLDPNDMAEMRPITFKSRDGLTIHGYITLPKEAIQGKKVPVIVNPHGGPQGVRDSWGFNPEAQLFASRGYATLQVNFRISGGYGKEFLKSGFKQVGRKTMDDVEDGLQYVIDQGWVDGKKAAIYGGSHGGYAVLRGLTKTPDLYACGVDYVGVSNIFTFMETIPAYWKPYEGILKEVWYDPDVPEENAIMKEVSPVFNIEKIEKPLMVVQGANDPRVNINESDQIVAALREKGIDVPYMVKYDEGHGFAKEENSLELYETMMGFFAKHLKDNKLTQEEFKD
ncbi:S9 family peptidase [Christiangramia crocea]|uniref:S9 family peptidase n=1 Tax=Christiangramia crocea TaxID=2904124 RepID=A0A9X1UXU1_9FLAO|nr:S9 family peptidase [Gramella crocea]MCG9972382.1 S9 family peptidase [Gramella crocea]